MARNLARSFMLMLLVLLIGCGASPELKPLAADAVILAFGDSLTYGTGAGREHSYPAVLAQLSGREVYNAGIPGEISAEGLRRLPQVLEEIQPALVVLCHGGNDILRKQSQEQAGANLASMVELIRASGAQVVMLGVPKPGLFLAAAPFYEQVADTQQVAIDLDTIPSMLKQNSLKSDAVHFNKLGYSKLAESVFDLLRKHGALP